jgi:hypothetical protein
MKIRKPINVLHFDLYCAPAAILYSNTEGGLVIDLAVAVPEGSAVALEQGPDKPDSCRSLVGAKVDIVRFTP